MSGLAEYDKERNNFLAELAAMKRRVAELERWATPIGVRALPNPPAIKAWRTSAQSIPDITQTVVTSLTDSYSEEGLELEDGNVIKLRRDSETEWYSIWFLAQFAAHVSNNRVVILQVRNINTAAWTSLEVAIHRAGQNGLNTIISSTILYAMGSEDDAVRFQVYQDSGGALDLSLFLVNAMLVKSGDAIAP